MGKLIPLNSKGQGPIFIGGAGSSGSTLLSILLDNHPDIFCGPELSLFNKAELYKDFKSVQKNFSAWMQYGLKTEGYFRYYNFVRKLDRYTIKPDEMLQWLEDASSLREFINCFVAETLERNNAKIFAEKTPSNGYCFPQLAKVYPEAKFIHLVRDGRDVVCSLHSRGFSWFQATSMWLYNTLAAEQLRLYENYYLFSYDKLVTQPEMELQKLCNFLEVEFYPAMANPQSAERKSKGEASQHWALNPTDNEISDRSVGRYTSDLTPAGTYIFLRTTLTREGQIRLSANLKNPLELLYKFGYADEFDAVHRWYYHKMARLQLWHDRVARNLQSVKRGESLEKPLTTIQGTDA